MQLGQARRYTIINNSFSHQTIKVQCRRVILSAKTRGLFKLMIQRIKGTNKNAKKQTNCITNTLEPHINANIKENSSIKVTTHTVF